MKYETHDFYCLKCGNKGMPCRRKTGHQYKKFHRKKLYCIYCREEVNHIECKNELEVREFKANFERGVYKNEAQESISYVRDSRIW